MRKLSLMIRHRPDPKEDIIGRHQRFLNTLDADNKFLLFKKGEVITLDHRDMSSYASLNKVLPKGLKGRIVYSLRNEEYLRDNAQYDDYILINFKDNFSDYEMLIASYFTKLITAFSGYRATVYDDAINLLDWDKVALVSRETGRDINGRDGVYRINVANYFDNVLCKREFGLSSIQVFERLNGRLDTVIYIADGVFFLYSVEILEESEILAIDENIRSFLLT